MTTLIYILTGIMLLTLLNLLLLWVNRDKKIRAELDKTISNRLWNYKYEYEKSQKEIYNLKFIEWKNENEFDIRRKAIHTSKTLITDSISEELSIINNNFAFNPKDIKFVGRFIDLIIFDGSADETDVSIYFVEIINKSHLDKHGFKPRVEEAIKNGRYTFKEINL